jgi:hypothetical protein
VCVSRQTASSGPRSRVEKERKSSEPCHSFPKVLWLISRPRRGRFWQRKKNALRSTVTDEDRWCGNSRRAFPVFGDFSVLFIQTCHIRNHYLFQKAKQYCRVPRQLRFDTNRPESHIKYFFVKNNDHAGHNSSAMLTES